MRKHILKHSGMMVSFYTMIPNLEHRNALEKALHAESRRGNSNQNSSDLIAIQTWFDLSPKPYQQEMLDRLAAERAHQRYRNLVVAQQALEKPLLPLLIMLV